MSKIRGRVLPVLLAATVVVGGANLAAYAANGKPVLLGNTNVASKTTIIKNNKGTALKIKSKSGVAPLKVSNTTKVTKLNADLVDGLEGASLQNKTYTYTLTGTSATGLVRFALPGLPAGRYLASYTVNATVTGAPTFFGCLFDSGAPFANAKVANLGINSGGFFNSASGYLDTTALTYTFTCQTDGTGQTIPAAGFAVPAQVVLTRLDDVTTTATTGAPGKNSASAKAFGN